LRPFLLLLVGLFAVGCAPRADQVATESAPVMTGRFGALPGYAVKQVRGKLRDTEVLGDDGSVCRLTVERFKNVDIGEFLACNWTITPDTIPTIARSGA
jgi:hypothetical protein